MDKITIVTLRVADQQQALQWYKEKLGWKEVANMPFPGDDTNRWITVAPPGQTEIEVVLQPPEWGTFEDENVREELSGKDPGFVIVTDDCRGEVETLKGRGVQIVSEPEEMPWGISAVFADPDGHMHNLLQPSMG
ncbi:MAG: VOC family protein [Caldilineaceae bacterium]